MKIFTNTCAIIIVFLVIIGCSADSGKLGLSPDGTKFQVKNAQTAEITIYFPSSEGKKIDKLISGVLAEIEKRTKETLNIKLHFKFSPTDTFPLTIKDILKNNEPCDAFVFTPFNDYTGDNRVFASASSLINAGLALDLTDLLQKEAPLYYASMPRELLKGISYLGRIYGIPNNFPVPSRMCAIVREDLMKKYKIAPIKNLTDYDNYLKTVKENEEGVFPLAVRNVGHNLFAEYYGYALLHNETGLVYKFNDPQMQVYYWEEIPEYQEICERLNNWYLKGYLLADTYYAPIDEWAFTSGKVASFIMPQGGAARMNQTLYLKNIKTYRYIEFPLYPQGESSIYSYNTRYLIINPASPHPERILQFVEWMHQNQENYDLLFYGLKGTDYNIKNAKLVKAKSDDYFALNDLWPSRAVLRDFRFERVSPYDDADYWTKITNNPKNIYPAHLGFAIDFSQNSQTVKARWSSYYIMESFIIDAGRYSQQALDDYRKKQQEQGAAALAAEIHNQLLAWKQQSP